MAGLARARVRAAELGIRLVAGCEVACVPVATGGVHVLVYFVDDPSSPLGLELDRLRDDRRVRNLELVERLNHLGVPVTFDQVTAHAGSDEGVGRPHFAQAMVDLGVVGNIRDTLQALLPRVEQRRANHAKAAIAAQHVRATRLNLADFANIKAGYVLETSIDRRFSVEASRLQAPHRLIGSKMRSQ